MKAKSTCIYVPSPILLHSYSKHTKILLKTTCSFGDSIVRAIVSAWKTWLRMNMMLFNDTLSLVRTLGVIYDSILFGILFQHANHQIKTLGHNWLGLQPSAFFRGLCEYVWVNILTLSPRRVLKDILPGRQVLASFTCPPAKWLTVQKKATIHQVTTMLPLLKMSYFQVITTC